MVEVSHTSTPAVPAYTVTARVLHWLVAALVLIMVPLGIVIANEWGGPVQQPLYNLHKSIGAVLLPLVVVRLIYRLMHPPLPLPADISTLQQFAAHATHWMLYGMLIAQPIIGLIATSAYPAPIPVFGLFELPPVWPENRALSERLFAAAPVSGDRNRRGRVDAYRRSVASPLLAQGPGSHAHDQRLTAGHPAWRPRPRAARLAASLRQKLHKGCAILRYSVCRSARSSSTAPIFRSTPMGSWLRSLPGGS